MKFIIVFAVCFSMALAFSNPPNVARIDEAEIQQILEAINHPSTDSTTAAALEQMLLDLLGIAKPEPADENDDSPMQIIPGTIEESIITDESEVEPIAVLPEMIDESIVSEPANTQSSPVVQIIVNVNANEADNSAGIEEPAPVIIVEQPEIKPDDVIDVENLVIVPDQVSIVETPEVKPESVIVVPVNPIPI